MFPFISKAARDFVVAGPAARGTPAEPSAAGAPAVLRIAGRDELARMQPAFRRALAGEFDIGALSGKLCPVELDDGRVAVFAVEEYADGGHIAEVERMVARRACALAQPARIVVPATLLLSIARGQITGDTLRNRRTILLDPAKSSMADAFHDIVAWGARHGASDIHINLRTLEAESEVRFTVDGRYVAPERFRHSPTATLADVLAVAYMDIQGGNGAVFDPNIEQQGSIHHDVDGRPLMLRWASLATDAGPSVTMRILQLDPARRPSTLEELGYLPSQVAAMRRALLGEGGAVVLAGVVGSGKSTTIASMMASIPSTRKVVTLEDPVEYLIPNALQNSVSRPLDGSTAGEFDAKLKTVKRSAMNDLLIGEIRDQATGRAFMDLASSGSNLYTTTHAGSAALIPDRLASDFIGVSRRLLATPGILKLLVYQALLPRLCPHCALPFAALFDAGPRSAAGRGLDAQGRDGACWRRYAERIARLYGIDPAALRTRNPEGCRHCRNEALPEHDGLAGRTVAAELIDPAVDDAFLRFVRSGDTLGARRHVAATRRAAFDDPDMQGKSAMECAVYKAAMGSIDPRDIEPRFVSFETVELRRGVRRPRGLSIGAGRRPSVRRPAQRMP
ncbi:ATPase, T2SS/T4P/T4SS family [Pigmentiphaga soli]|uniref:ATPase, T2SS/T4P/T4SS family n=1 Tax=Pigmentiphaga soli TaxID=1007095 RepID=A0ABP8GEU3_9BURK